MGDGFYRTGQFRRVWTGSYHVSTILSTVSVHPVHEGWPGDESRWGIPRWESVLVGDPPVGGWPVRSRWGGGFLPTSRRVSTSGAVGGGGVSLWCGVALRYRRCSLSFVALVVVGVVVPQGVSVYVWSADALTLCTHVYTPSLRYVYISGVSPGTPSRGRPPLSERVASCT